MKKRTIILTLVAVFIIGALFAKFTGLIVTSVNTCTDSDSGKNYDLKGNVQGIHYILTKEEYFQEDYCKDQQTLIEHYCVIDGMHSYKEKEEYTCPTKCEQGACTQGLREIPTPPQNQTTDLLEKGWVKKIIDKIKDFF